MATDILASGEYEQEDFDAAVKGYPGFRMDLYLKLNDQLPTVFANLTYYKRVDHQTEDSYAVFNHKNATFVIQLDPLCEVIALWGTERTY